MDDVVGKLTLPAGTALVTDLDKVGTQFFTPIIILLITIAGIWSLLQFVLGGLGTITAAGDPKKVQEAQSKITHSIIGLAIIAVSFILTALISQLFFGRWDFVLNPSIQTQ